MSRCPALAHHPILRRRTNEAEHHRHVARRRFIVSLDGPPLSGENHTVIIDEHDMIREVTNG